MENIEYGGGSVGQDEYLCDALKVKVTNYYDIIGLTVESGWHLASVFVLLTSYSKFPSSSGFCRTMLALSFLPKEIRLRVMMSQLDAVRAQD